ncbi:hypothetical protein ACFTXJ_14090 [Streptomyces zhihengii]|uniref:hypothetical protein n=1 Tax=Streptomyces zhihengii TaxID=1818004 RepID=UPI00363D818F
MIDQQFARGLDIESPIRFHPDMACTLTSNGESVTVLKEGLDPTRVHRQIKIRDETGREYWVHTNALRPAGLCDQPTEEQLCRGLEDFSAALVNHRSACTICRERFELGIVLSGTCLITRQLFWEYVSIQAAWRRVSTSTAAPSADKYTLW